jgi:hypothetical protein
MPAPPLCARYNVLKSIREEQRAVVRVAKIERGFGRETFTKPSGGISETRQKQY